MPKLIDLTRPLQIKGKDEFPTAIAPLYRILCPEIEFIDHDGGAAIMGQLFGCEKDELPDGEGWTEENLTVSSHLGTHVDAPWHYGSKTKDEPALTVDQIPLADLYCHGVVLDLSAKKGSAQAITAADLEAACKAISYEIKKGDAVLIRTDHDKFDLLDPARYNYPGMTRESTLWLIDRGATVGGTDATGWDRPFHVMIQEYKSSGDQSKIWDAHYAARQARFYIVQQLVNLHSLPPHGFQVAFFPIPYVGASAAPTRAVAFV
jgi:kynurenine formamidase